MWQDAGGGVHVAPLDNPERAMDTGLVDELQDLLRLDPDAVRALVAGLEEDFHARRRTFRAAREEPFVGLAMPAGLVSGHARTLIELQSALQSVGDRWQLDALRAVEAIAAGHEPSRPTVFLERVRESLRRPHL